MMQTERRSAPRQGINSLIYLDLEPDNGGILLNLSENGMQISVANRLVTSSEIRFTLRLQPSDKVCGTGRIAWLSPSGRSAGVHFIDLPQSARQEIRKWMSQSSDTLTANDTRELLAPAQDAPPIGAVAAASTEANAAKIEPPAFVVRQAPDEAESLAETLAVEDLPNLARTQGIPEPPAQPSVVVTHAPPSLEPVSVEAPKAEIPTTTAPVTIDALELLESTVDAQTLEGTPPAWTSPAAVAAETPVADGSGPHPSVLSLYGIDGREKEETKLPAPPAQVLKGASAKTPTPAAVARMKRRAEVRRRARAAALAPLRPRPEVEIESNPVILDGITDVSGSSRPSMPTAREVTPRARALNLTNAIFIPAPPQFQLPPPEKKPVPTYRPAAPAFEDTRTGEALVDSWPRQSPVESADKSLPETHATGTQRSPGALYLPNYKVMGITPDGTWRPSRIFSSPLLAIREVFERFELFGWSLESDWHVWLAMILLFAGFLALAQNPPLVVLTVAFWFASAMVILDRQRPHHGPMRPQKPDHR
jgi:hypothetical protein